MKFKLKVEDQVKIFLTAIIVILMVAVSSGYFYYEKNVKKTWYTKTTKYGIPVFNTEVFFQFYTSINKFNPLYDEAVDKLIYYHKLFDRHNISDYYIDDDNKDLGVINNLKTINESYGTGNPVKVDYDLANILLVAMEQGEQTDGSFNIAVGELSSLWTDYFSKDDNFDGVPDYQFCNDESCQPSPSVIEKLKVCTPSVEELEKILLITNSNGEYYVTFNKFNDCEKVSISLGGIAKGYALKAIGDYFNTKGVLSLFTARSSSYYSQYRKELLSIKNYVVDPNKTDSYAFYIEGKSTLASSTSGDYEQGYYVRVDNKYIKRHHIIDTTTGYSNNYYHSVSAYLNDPLVADILTTAFFNLNLNEGYDMYLKYKTLYPELEVVWITNDSLKEKSVIATTGIYDKIIMESNYKLVKIDDYIEGGL